VEQKKWAIQGLYIPERNIQMKVHMSAEWWHVELNRTGMQDDDETRG